MSRQTTTPAILSEEPPGLLSLGWDLFLNLKSVRPELNPRGRDKKARYPILRVTMMPAAQTHFHNYLLNDANQQTGGIDSRKSLIVRIFAPGSKPFLVDPERADPKGSSIAHHGPEAQSPAT